MPMYIREAELKPQHMKMFRALAQRLRKTRVRLALIIAQLDPDALALAKLTRAAFEHAKVDVAGIFYAGPIGHRQNHKIFEEFKLSTEIQPIAELPEGCKHFLLDSHRHIDTRLLQTKFKPESVVGFIDHHQVNGKLPDPNDEERFMWNATVAAATTLGWMLAKRLSTPIDRELATLAAIGIYSDSDRLASGFLTPEDIAAYTEAIGQADIELFSACCNYSLSKRHRLILAQVLNNCVTIGHYHISHPSTRLSEKDGDDIATYADQLSEYEDARTVIVWGLCGSEIRYSIRSTGEGSDVGNVLDLLFGKATGGTKPGSGGGRFRLPDQIVPSDEAGNATFIAFLSTHLQSKLASFTGVNENPDTTNP